MKRIILFLCAAVLLLGGCSSQKAPPASAPASETSTSETPAGTPSAAAGVAISCLSFNILAYNTGSSSYALPQDRAPGVIEVIRNSGADIVGVQEASQTGTDEPFDWVETLTGQLADLYDARVILDDTPSFWRTPISAGLIIFYRKGRFSLEDSGCYEYYDDPNRYFQWVKLKDDAAGGKTLFVTNTHLSIESGGGNEARVGEATELYEFWRDTVGDNALFATGDYNCYDGDDPHLVLQQGAFFPSYTFVENSSAGYDFCYINKDHMNMLRYNMMEKDFTMSNGETVRLSDHSPVMSFAAYK